MQFREDGPLGLYFEDYEVGQKMRTRGRTITESDLVQFAALTGDYNPMHTDAEYAKNSFLGRRVAHGMLALSYAVGQTYQLGFLERTVLSFRSVDMKFSAPVYIGDTIHVELTIIDKKEARRLGGGTVTIEVRIVNQEGKVVQKGEWTALVASKSAQTESANPESSAE